MQYKVKVLSALLLLVVGVAQAYGIPCEGVVQHGDEHKRDLSGKNRVFRIGARDFVPLWDGLYWEILERDGTCEDGNPLVRAPFLHLSDIQLSDKSGSAWDIFFDPMSNHLHAIACHTNPLHRKYVRVAWNPARQWFENKVELPLPWLPKNSNPCKIMADHDGHLLVLYDGDDNTIKLRRSADDGLTWTPDATLQSGILSGSLKATLDMVRYTYAGDEEMQFIYGLANGDIYRKRIDTPADKAAYDTAQNWTSELAYVSGQEPRSHAVILHAANLSDNVAIVYQTQAHFIQMLFWNGVAWEPAKQLGVNKMRRHSATWDTQNNQIHVFVEGNISLGDSDILHSAFTIETRSWGPEAVVINDLKHDMERPDPIRVTEDGSIFLVSDNNSQDFRAAWNLVGTPGNTGPKTVHCNLGQMTEWFRDQMTNNGQDWIESAFEAVLVDETYVFDTTQGDVANVIASQVGPLVTLNGQKMVRDDRTSGVKLDAHDVVFSSVADGQTVAGVVVVSESKVAGHCNVSDVSTNGNAIIVQFSSRGVFQF